MKYLICLIVLLSATAFGQDKKSNKVIYQYKQYERFDFDEIGVEGESGSPGDLSITPRPRAGYANKLPERPDFSREIKNAVNSIR